MRLRLLALLCVLIPAACAPLPPPPDTPQLPPGVFGVLDQDVPAVQYAAWAFAMPSRTYGNAVAGAQAVMAIEYIAGALNTAPRWAYIAPTTQMELLQGRTDTRAAIGIAANARSQLVVNSLYAARNYLQIGQTQAAEAAVANPAFTLPPAQIIQNLANLPYIRMANVATLHAEAQLFEPGGDDDRR